MTAFKLILLGFFALLGALWPGRALPAGQTVTVVEYYDPRTGRYFMTADPAEQEALDTVEAGRVRTGMQFQAWPAEVETCETRANGQVACAGSIVRFNYAAHDWFFYSPKPSEWAQLNAPDSGFIDRGVAFKAFLPDGPGGTCTQGRQAVFRSYKNQNHRFPANQAAHTRMVQTGSLDEGITFCAESARIVPLFEAPFRAVQRSGVRTEADCPPVDETEGCVVARNLQIPRFFEGELLDGSTIQAFANRSGFNGPNINTMGDPALSDRTFGTFVQFGVAPGQVGLHVNTGNRNIQGPSGLDVVYNLDRFTAPGDVDNRLIPFERTDGGPVELSMRFLLFVNVNDFLGGGSRTEGRLRLMFLDTSEYRFDVLAAERRIDLVVQLYGDRSPGNDTVTREGVTFTSLGRPVVTTSIERTTFGRQASNLPFLLAPFGFRSVNPWGMGGAFDYRVDAAALQRIVDAARTVDDNFSRDITQYQVLGYRIENEVEGPGRMGMSVRDITLELLRR